MKMKEFAERSSAVRENDKDPVITEELKKYPILTLGDMIIELYYELHNRDAQLAHILLTDVLARD